MQTVLEDDRLEDDRLEDEGENSAELILLLHLLACTNHLTLWAQMYALRGASLLSPASARARSSFMVAAYKHDFIISYTCGCLVLACCYVPPVLEAFSPAFTMYRTLLRILPSALGVC